MADGGWFALAGTVIGLVAKAGGPQLRSQRRAYGNVFAHIDKIKLELHYINYNLSKRDVISECVRYTRVANRALQIGEAQKYGRKFDPLTSEEELILGRGCFTTSDEFKRRSARIWEWTEKAEQSLTDNVLELSSRFTNTYWKFYRQFVPEDGWETPDHLRYPQAERVINRYHGRLKRAALGSFLLWLASVLALLVIGAGTGFFVMMNWDKISMFLPSITKDFVESLGQQFKVD